MTRSKNFLAALLLLVGIIAGGLFGPLSAHQTDAQSNGGIHMNVPVLAATTITASGNGAAVSGFGKTDLLRLVVTCSSVTGTSPSYTFNLQDSLDGTNFNTLASATALTANGSAVLNYAKVRGTTAQAYGDILRLTWTVTGTSPSASCFGNVYAVSD